MLKTSIQIAGRLIGDEYAPLIIAEIGINHEGDFDKAVRMVEDAHAAGCECVKFQRHVVNDEMIPNGVIPANASESIWEIMKRCSLTYEEDMALKELVEEKGMLYLSTPFSRAAAIELNEMGVCAFKIGSGECNNYPLVSHIAHYGKPVILSTGMNDIASIRRAVLILKESHVPFALLHCTSMYPTPYNKVRLGAIRQLQAAFPDAVVGFSDHSLGPYCSLASVVAGASIIERHFTSDRSWPGPDIPISMTPEELKELIVGSRAIHQGLGGQKNILSEEKATIDFAYASVVAIRNIAMGDIFSEDNIWVKRPGTGEIQAAEYHRLLGRRSCQNISANSQIEWKMVER